MATSWAGIKANPKRWEDILDVIQGPAFKRLSQEDRDVFTSGLRDEALRIQLVTLKHTYKTLTRRESEDEEDQKSKNGAEGDPKPKRKAAPADNDAEMKDDEEEEDEPKKVKKKIKTAEGSSGVQRPKGLGEAGKAKPRAGAGEPKKPKVIPPLNPAIDIAKLIPTAVYSFVGNSATLLDPTAALDPDAKKEPKLLERCVKSEAWIKRAKENKKVLTAADKFNIRVGFNPLVIGPGVVTNRESQYVALSTLLEHGDVDLVRGVMKTLCTAAQFVPISRCLDRLSETGDIPPPPPAAPATS